MFNQELKMIYLNTFDQTDRIIERSRLKKPEDYEQLLGKDLSEMSLEEIKTMFAYCNFSSAIVGYKYVDSFKRYTQWCIDTGKIANKENPYNQITHSMVELAISPFLRNSKYIEFDIIQGLVSDLKNAMDKAIVLGIYNGLLGEGLKEIILLRKEHISVEDNLVKVPQKIENGIITTGRVVSFDPQIISILLQAMDETVYMDFKGRMLDLVGDGIVKNIVLKREIKEKETSNEMFRAKIRVTDRLKKFATIYSIPALSPKNLWRSGLIYNIKQAANTYGVDPLEFIKTDYFKDIKNQYGINMNVYDFKTRYKDYLT